MLNRVSSMPINIKRPNSALLRGVQITEFKGHIINPDPIILQETDFLLEEFLSPTKLKALTGVNDLSSVEHLEMIVDTSETSLGNFGIYLPNLKQLKLNGSHVPRIRDLGTSLVNLKVLWLSRSGLTDLDGIPTLSNLEELYLAYNEISDLSSLSLLDNIKCLDLEGNLIDDIKQVEFLNLCSNLVNLTLYGNPICVKCSPDATENDPNYSYRHEIIKALPSLQILDDELTLNTKPLSATTKALTSSINIKDSKYQKDLYKQECPFDDDWQMINKFIEEGIGPPEEKLAINESVRPGTSSSHGSSSRANTSVRPLSAMRPLSSYRIKTSLAQQRPSSRLNTSNSLENGSRISTANSQQRPNTDPVCDIPNDASNLTVGPTLQGNPLRSLLSRRRNNKSADGSDIIETKNIKPLDANLNEPATFDSALKSLKKTHKKDEKLSEIESENKDLKDEIKKWKKDHAKKLEERKEYFQPQVLQIDDAYEEPLTDLENEEDYYDPNQYYNNNNDKNNVNSSNLDEQISILSLKDSSRPKSAFKQNFDYDENSNIVEINDDSNDKEKKKHRSKSRSSSDKNKKDKKDRPRSRSRSSKHSSKDQDSRSSSRIATGDTGYESISTLSLSSSFSTNLNNNTNTSKSITKLHQPIIVSSNSSASSSNQLVKSSNSINNLNDKVPLKPLTQQQSSTLKQLKTNLLPLSGIKLPK